MDGFPVRSRLICAALPLSMFSFFWGVGLMGFVGLCAAVVQPNHVICVSDPLVWIKVLGA